jgi:phage-related protein
VSDQHKDIIWVGSSKEDLSEFPLPVKREMGFALRAAQQGERHEGVEAMQGFRGTTVLEIKDDHDTNTYRVMYLAEFAEAVYVLHAFKKKSTAGINLPKREVRTLDARLKKARESHEALIAKQKGKK